MSYSFFPNDFTSLPNLQDQAFLMKQKQVNEGSRPTFIPLTTAYDDSNDPAPNVAALTDEEEEDLRVDRVDNFGGAYPNAEYARLDRSLDSYNDARIGTNVELSRHREQARRDAMDKIHRGRPLRDYKRSSPTAQKANKEFNQSYRYPEELMDRARGQKVMADISNKILKAHPDHAAFQKMYNERSRVD